MFRGGSKTMQNKIPPVKALHCIIGFDINIAAVSTDRKYTASTNG